MVRFKPRLLYRARAGASTCIVHTRALPTRREAKNTIMDWSRVISSMAYF
jgi:hypothetical protein